MTAVSHRRRLLRLVQTSSTPVLITGPAGSGKTSLMRSLRESARGSAVMVQGRHGVHEAPIGAALLAAADEALRPRLAAILEQTAPDDPGSAGITVLLDRADHAESHDVVSTVRTLLDAGVGVVVAARDLRSPVCRLLRFGYAALQVGAADLAFTVEEARDLLDLPEPVGEQLGVAVADYVARCGGWAAGVGLLADRLSHADPADALTVEAAWTEFVDYLDHWVLTDLDRHDLRLLALAVVEALAEEEWRDDGAAAAGRALTLTELRPDGLTDLAARAERLAADGLFVPPGAAPQHRRIHPAVHAAVHAAMRRDPTLDRAAWEAAVSARLDTGRHADAVRLAARCGIDDLFAVVIARTWPSIYAPGLGVASELTRLPEAVRRRHPPLLVLQSLILSLRQGDVGAIDVALRTVGEPSPSAPLGLQVMIKFCSMAVAVAMGRPAQAAELAGWLTEELRRSDLDPAIRSNACRGLGYYWLISGDVQAARREFDAARSAGNLAGLPSLSMAATPALALISGLLGRASDAERYLEEALESGADVAQTMAAGQMAITIAQAFVSMLRGEPARAAAMVEGVRDLRGGAEFLAPSLAMTQALSLRWQGEGARARSEVEATAGRSADAGLTEFQRGTFRLSQFLAMFGSERFPEAESVARTLVPDPVHILCAPTALGMALLGQGDAAGAAAAVRECLDSEAHVPHTRVLALWIAALAGWISGDPAALLHFERALALARSSDVVGWTVTFLPQPPPVQEMIAALRARTVAPGMLDLLRQVERAQRELGSGAPADATPGDRPTPLSNRELEVAELVAAGLTNRMIADRLVLSPRTVDGHVERILAKLGFRSQAGVAAWVARRAP